MAVALPKLEQIDPAEAWRAWQPSATDPWNRKWAAHLYRRAAFGVSREYLLEAERLGLQGTLDLLFQGRFHAEEGAETLVSVGRIAAGSDDSGDQLRAWWLYCMLQSGHPVREDMTLFWPYHFTLGITNAAHTT